MPKYTVPIPLFLDLLGGPSEVDETPMKLTCSDVITTALLPYGRVLNLLNLAGGRGKWALTSVF